MNLTERLSSQQRRYDWHFAAAVAIDAEEAVKTCGWLDPSAIQTKPLRLFWENILKGDNVIEASRKAGPTINQELSAHIARLPDIGSASDYAGALAEASYFVDTALNLEEAASFLGKGDKEALQQSLAKLTKNEAPGGIRSRNANESIEAFIAQLGNMTGRAIQTNIIPLDRALGGIERQSLTILAARPSMGKSALAWQVARNIARAGKTVVFFSLEDSEINLWARAACGPAGVAWRTLRADMASDNQKHQVTKMARREMESLGGRLFVNDKRNTSSTIWSELATLKPDFFVIDHLRLLKDKSDSEVRRLGWITERMKDAAKEFDCAALVLAQLNRGVEMRDNKRPRLADLRDSGEIEENADTVLFMYRDDYYEKDDPPKVSETELSVAKFRSDAANKLVRLGFDLEKQYFDLLPQGAAQTNGYHKQAVGHWSG